MRTEKEIRERLDHAEEWREAGRRMGGDTPSLDVFSYVLRWVLEDSEL